MQDLVSINGLVFKVDWGHPQDISLPQFFRPDSQPSFFGAPPARSEPFAAGAFIGDTRRGGSCNVASLNLIPHTCGTHTECVGHIADTNISLPQLPIPPLVPALLLSITPSPAFQVDDRYTPVKREEDRLISAESLQRGIEMHDPAFLEALVLRTLPNEPSKRERNYSTFQPPFLSLDAIEYLVGLGIQHLLLDTPSADRPDDGGIMCVHRAFWGVAPGERQMDPTQYSTKTITEMIFVPDTAPDGTYLLNLQIPHFMTDAVPSRPLLFPAILSS